MLSVYAYHNAQIKLNLSVLRYSVALMEFHSPPLHLLGQVADRVSQQLDTATASEIFLYAVCMENASMTSSNHLKQHFLKCIEPYIEDNSAPFFTVLRCLRVHAEMVSPVQDAENNEELLDKISQYFLSCTDFMSSMALYRISVVLFKEHKYMHEDLADALCDKAVSLFKNCYGLLECVNLMPALVRSRDPEIHAQMKDILIK